MTIDSNQLLHDYMKSYMHSNEERYVIIGANFKKWDDYVFDSNLHIYVLKDDAVPRSWYFNGNDVKTLDELIVQLQLNCINGEHLLLDLRDKEEKMFVDAWKNATNV